MKFLSILAAASLALAPAFANAGSSAETTSSQFSGSDDVLRSMVQKAVERLRDDGLIR